MKIAESAETPLIVVQERPFNAETPLRILGEVLTPTEAFYVRSNFDVPALDSSTWRLQVSGCVGGERSWSIEDLRSEPAIQTAVTVECAGNGRMFMRPLPPGTPWNLGAVGTAVFKGVPLRMLLERSGVDASAVEVVFGGADGGEISEGRTIRFERSLPISEAIRDDVLVAYEMNGEPLSAAHGFPARLVVPGYYGVAWVKWLTEIRVVKTKFDGHFQVERYIYRNDDTLPPEHPVTRMRVRALIISPAADTVVQTGVLTVYGTAWSGSGEITSVAVSADGGVSWLPATLETAPVLFRATPWSASVPVVETGRLDLMCRATDSTGATQPLQAVYNDLGYGNNVVHCITLTVE
jgi:DMSO/TMAO reductase YedYZ molybdopterin-dependent catalytic subunit